MQRLAALREDLEAEAAAPVPIAAAVPPSASGQPSDAAVRELEQYIGQQQPKVSARVVMARFRHGC
jgi:hypothetical protein